MVQLDAKTIKIIRGFQKNEITEHFIYQALSHLASNENNHAVIERLSEEELRHYNIWSKYSGEKITPDKLKCWLYVIVARIFGLTFAIKLMEAGENNAQVAYTSMAGIVPEAEDIQREENEHESALVRMVDEEKLKYMGSMVLGLNDALVEFSGALAGFTFALQNTRLIGMVGLIMGISASLSMAASEYFSTKTEAESRNPVKASLYTGAAYIATVAALVSPFLVFSNPYFSLAATLGCAVLLILIFTFYSSVVNEVSFRGRFTEMLIVSMGVAALSFAIGLVVKKVMGIDL